MASSGNIVLCYGNYVIRDSEMKILQGNKWLNDVIIGFYFEYLENEIHKEEDHFKFFGPEVTHCIKLSLIEDPEVLFGDAEKAATWNYMFWPVNNSEDPNQQNGGTHWSLLVYSRKENVYAHFDSTHGSNGKTAEVLHDKLTKLITPRAPLQHRGCEFQENGFDCGLHVISNARIIAEYVTKTGGLNGVHTAKSSTAGQMRKTLIDLIDKLAKPGNDNGNVGNE